MNISIEMIIFAIIYFYIIAYEYGGLGRPVAYSGSAESATFT